MTNTNLNHTHRTPGERGTPMRLALAMAAAAIALVTLLSATPASAHRGEQSYLYLDVAATDLDGRVELPYEDLREAFGLELEPPSESITAELAANLPMIIDYIQDHTSIGAEGQTWELTFSDFRLLSDVDNSEQIGYAIFPFEIDLPTTDVPRVLDITFDPFFDEIDNRDAIVLVGNDWQRGVFEQEANELKVFDPNNREGTIDLGKPSQWLNFTGSISLGVNHIRTGPDHIFFVMVLLLPSVLVFASSWRPSPSFGAALWRVLKMVSMFTLAHSITFTLAGLGILPLPPSKLVETIIALSIAAAALHNLRPILLNREWAMAFIFGLFHGLGFASLVETLDTGRGTQLISLLGRNVGIEVGQAVVILLVFPTLHLLRRTRFYRPIFVLGSLVLTVLAVIWAFERIFEFDLGTTDLTLIALRWPRSAVLMVIVTGIAAAIHSVENKAGRLLPVADSDGGGSYDSEMVDAVSKVPSTR